MVIGDKPINKVAKEDIKEALSFKKCMPVMNKNPYRQWGVEETVQRIKEGYEVEDDEDLVSSKTVKETLKCYQSFFSSFLFPNSSPKCDTLQFKRLASFLQKPWLAA